jgi:hypothetical protein
MVAVARRVNIMKPSSVVLERILFGDNQFFGVNHMSEEKARAQAVKFQESAAIIEVLDTAYDEGIRVFMCTTHCRDLRSRASQSSAIQRLTILSLHAVCA